MTTRGRPQKTIIILEEQLEKLLRVAKSTKVSLQANQRANIIVLAHQGLKNRDIANAVHCTISTVTKWRKRWRETPTVESLHDAHRSGAPARIKPHHRAGIIKIACHRVDGDKTPFRDIHTSQSIADQFRAETGVSISRSEVSKILRNNSIRPHRVRMWLTSQDPLFYEKAKEVTELYLNPPRNSIVLCVDEKPMQALSRKYPTIVDKWNGISKREYEYKRNGTRTLIGAFNVHSGEVYGWVCPDRKAPTLLRFMHSLADLHPGKEIHVVWDNLNIHHNGPSTRWDEFNKNHDNRFHFHYTPLHASWLNQVECWFSILERRVLKQGSFESCEALENRVEGFIEYWNSWEAHRFNWTFRPQKA